MPMIETHNRFASIICIDQNRLYIELIDADRSKNHQFRCTKLYGIL